MAGRIGTRAHPGGSSGDFLTVLAGRSFGVSHPAYGASVAIDSALADYFVVTATDGTAFAIGQPANPPDDPNSSALTVEVANASGGSLGSITWDSSFKLAGSFTAPANGKSRTISFRWNGAAWVEVSRAGADI